MSIAGDLEFSQLAGGRLGGSHRRADPYFSLSLGAALPCNSYARLGGLTRTNSTYRPHAAIFAAKDVLK